MKNLHTSSSLHYPGSWYTAVPPFHPPRLVIKTLRQNLSLLARRCFFFCFPAECNQRARKGLLSRALLVLLMMPMISFPSFTFHLPFLPRSRLTVPPPPPASMVLLSQTTTNTYAAHTLVPFYSGKKANLPFHCRTTLATNRHHPPLLLCALLTSHSSRVRLCVTGTAQAHGGEETSCLSVSNRCV